MSTHTGIMGGTFDPIHVGHLIAAEAARWRFSLDRVLFVPTGQPWQKPVDITDPEDRYRMTVLGVDGNPAFDLPAGEHQPSGPRQCTHGSN